jgi:type IV pilus assembly protein PilB
MGIIVGKRIGELLVEAGVLSQSQLEKALFAQRKDGRKLGQLLIELGLVGEVQLTQTLSRQLTVPWVSLYHVDFSRSLLNMVPREIAEKYCLIPIFLRRVRKQGETLYVAMDDPTNDAAIGEVAKASALAVKPMIACPTDIRAAIRVYYLGETAAAAPPAANSSAVVVAPLPAPAPTAQPALKVAAPPLPKRARSRPEIAPREAGQTGVGAVSRRDGADSPEAAPEIHTNERDVFAPRRMRAKMISLTLLDGTTISIPSRTKNRPSRPDLESGDELSSQLTARDLVSALRAVAHGAEAGEILGSQPRWEAMFSVLLSILLRKGLIADWEFVEEFRKI